MSDGCPRLEALAGVMELPKSDPLRNHVIGCPRCRARLTAYRVFMEAEPLPEGAMLADARDRIQRALHDEIEGPAPAIRPVRRKPWILRLTGSSLHSWWRPALGVVGVTAALILVLRLGVLPGGNGDEGPVLREHPAALTGGPVVLEPVREADGSVTLRWTPCAGADSYEVILYGADLKEEARIPAGAETVLHLSRDRLGELREAPFCVVSALDRGDEIGRSDPVILPRR